MGFIDPSMDAAAAVPQIVRVEDMSFPSLAEIIREKMREVCAQKFWSGAPADPEAARQNHIEGSDGGSLGFDMTSCRLSKLHEGLLDVPPSLEIERRLE
jgi:hypothetical protein